MQEKKIDLSSIDPVELFGATNDRLKIIKSYFPKLKIIARGTSMKVNGDDEELYRFEDKMNMIIDHYQKYNRLTENDIERILTSETVISEMEEEADVLVYGNGGVKIRAKTANQKKMVEELAINDMLFAVGPAGTGKTYTAVALAVRALKNREIKRIILTRPAVEAGEQLGFLPGDMKEKLDPYLQPLYDALWDMVPQHKLQEYLENGVIQIAPLAYMRGRTLDKAYVILDEAQNATESQLKMFLTRMGMSAKFIITGDLTQVDLPRRQTSGLRSIIKRLEGIEGITVVRLEPKDVIRHKIVTRIIHAFEEDDKNKEDKKD